MSVDAMVRRKPYINLLGMPHAQRLRTIKSKSTVAGQQTFHWESSAALGGNYPEQV